jgi:hypothetical protein
MRRLFIFSLIVCASVFLFSCGKEGKSTGLSQSSQQLIVGRWSLQQQKVVQYIDGVVQTDTTYNTAPNNIARVQFNKDGTFSSISLYSSPEMNGGLSAGGVTTADSTSGVFNFAGTKFNVSAPLAGLGSGSFAFAGTTSYSTVSVFSSVSNSIQINELTVSRLKLHTENIYTLTNNNVTQTYKNEADYYYAK